MDRGDYISGAQLQEIAGQVKPEVKLEADAEKALQDVADDFVEHLVAFACELVHHRGGSTVESADMQLALEKNWNARLPGVGDDAATADLRSIKWPAGHTDIHSQRLQMVRRSKQNS